MAFPAPDVVTFGAFTSSTPKNPIAELKNGKVIFKQKPVSLAKASETMQGIVKFREMLESRVQNQDLPLASIPEEHKPLIVKLAQESDKAVVPLARQIRSILLPGPGEVEDAHRLSLESNLPLAVVEHAIKMVMTRMNYGLDGPLGQKIPAAVCVWRWEVQDAYKDWLPKSARDSADARLAERIQASADLRAAFESLSQAEQDAILVPKGAFKLPVNDLNKSETGVASTTTNENFLENHTQKDAPSDMADGEVLAENFAPKGHTKKVPNPEKAVKIKDKEEKRAAKAEKEKKQKEAQNRSRSIMVNFFGKAKPSVQDPSTRDSNASAGPLTDSEFQKTFKPFVLKKDAEIAPYNWFLESKRRSHNRMTGVSHQEAIVVDDDTSLQGVPDPVMSSSEMMLSTGPGDSLATLQGFNEELRQSGLIFRRRKYKVSSLKTNNSRSVRDIISQLNDAEIAGDPTQVRHLLSVLQDRHVFPAKVLIFHEDSRPGYYGTWTRNSREVGPRTPLERDVLARDYGYDSGEDWEDEGPGDADDVVDDGEDDEPDAEDADSDLDSWLVDDDDEIRLPLDLDNLSSPHLDLAVPPSKRKAENIEKRSDKKRKVVVPLVPYVKGPFWESYIGHCEYDPLNPYRIQLLNDTPHPIDPFTFVSVVSDEGLSSQVDPPFALPGGAQPLVGTAVPKRTMSSAPKTVFPEAHLGTLLAKITDLATPNFTFLVESIYQDLRIHKIKKNAIEAKVREIGEKSKDKKVWVVKQAAQALHPPS